MRKPWYILGSLALLPIVLALSGTECIASSDKDECIEKIRSIYGELSNTSIDPDNKDTYYVDYSVRTVTHDSARRGPIESRIQMWMQGESIRIISKEMEIYQDKKEVFTVMPMQRALVRSDKMMDPKNQYNKSKTAMFQDTLFALSEVSYCGAISGQNGVDKRVVLKLSPEGQKLLKVNSVVFDIDETQNQIKKVRINYTTNYKSASSPLSPIAHTEYVVNQLDSHNARDIADERVANFFLEGNGKLKSKYQGYEFMDARYKSNKSILNQNGG